MTHRYMAGGNRRSTGAGQGAGGGVAVGAKGGVGGRDRWGLEVCVKARRVANERKGVESWRWLTAAVLRYSARTPLARPSALVAAAVRQRSQRTKGCE